MHFASEQKSKKIKLMKYLVARSYFPFSVHLALKIPAFAIDHDYAMVEWRSKVSAYENREKQRFRIILDPNCNSSDFKGTLRFMTNTRRTINVKRIAPKQLVGEQTVYFIFCTHSSDWFVFSPTTLQFTRPYLRS